MSTLSESWMPENGTSSSIKAFLHNTALLLYST